MEHIIIDGLTLCKTSYVNSRFRITRGLKFSITTSEIETSLKNKFLPLRVSRRNPRFFLFRFNLFVTRPIVGKGTLGSLILMTSAPKSANVRVPNGPAHTLVRSIILTLLSAPEHSFLRGFLFKGIPYCVHLATVLA